MTYAEKLKHPKWQRRRLEVLERDGFKCRDCGESEKQLHVHHCHYEKGEPWDTSLRFLQTLCEDCHTRRGDLEADGKRALGMIFSRLNTLQLEALVTSLVQIAETAEAGHPVVVDDYQYMYEADIRWYSAACDNEELRPIYDRLTRSHTDWKALDQKREVRCHSAS
jgi:hypothetical protein